MFIGDNRDTHQAATQKLMDAAVNLRRASDALMAVQSLFTSDERKNAVRTMRAMADRDAVWLDQRFQEAVEAYFR